MSDSAPTPVGTFSRRGLLGLGAGVGSVALLGVPAVAKPPLDPPPPPAKKVLAYTYRKQATQSWCSAASTRIALSAQGKRPSQKKLAGALGLKGGHGLQDPALISRVLNNRLGLRGKGFRYRLKIAPSGTLKRNLRKNVVTSVRNGYPVVINMNSVAGDDFSAGHYVAIVGYRKGQYLLSDPYDPARKRAWYAADKVVAWNKLNRYTAATGS